MRGVASFLVVALVCATVLLTGCPQPQPRPSPQPPAPEPAPAAEPAKEPAPFSHQPVTDADRIVAYYGYLTTLSAEQMSHEYERTLRFYREQYSDLTFMQLVLLRIMPNTPFRDTAQARDMLSSFLKEPRVRSSELQPFALLLQSLLGELQQKDADVLVQAQKLKDETKRYDVVKQKLDALIDAERKMLERNKPVRSQ